ncbi:Flagellar biosynthetic protein FliP [Alcanivorax sp. ALC70]|nr:Flagellar biosynthetic protein FliP [Alcanivorax sp. ALC70]
MTAARRALPWLILAAGLLPGLAWSQAVLPGIVTEPTAGGGQEWSIKLQTLLLLSSLAFLPPFC